MLTTQDHQWAGMMDKIAEWIGCVIVAVVATLIFGSANHLPDIAKWCGIL